MEPLRPTWPMHEVWSYICGSGQVILIFPQRSTFYTLGKEEERGREWLMQMKLGGGGDDGGGLASLPSDVMEGNTEKKRWFPLPPPPPFSRSRKIRLLVFISPFPFSQRMCVCARSKVLSFTLENVSLSLRALRRLLRSVVVLPQRGTTTKKKRKGTR